jgi:hypothetical protein
MKIVQVLRDVPRELSVAADYAIFRAGDLEMDELGHGGGDKRIAREIHEKHET